MDKNVKVSIMIPTYNREDLIEETIDSAISQDFSDFEIIVVDNCSTDATYEKLCDYEKKNQNVHVFQNEKNIGPVNNWIEGFKHCNGEYVKILWSDDLMSIDFLSKTVPILEQNENIGFVYTLTEIFSDNYKRLKYKLGRDGTYKSNRFVIGHCMTSWKFPVSPGNALFRLKDVKDKVVSSITYPTFLDLSQYGAGSDLLVFLNICSQYEYFYYNNDVLSFFRGHNESFSIKNDLSYYYFSAKRFFLRKNIKNRFNQNFLLVLLYIDFFVIKIVKKCTCFIK